MPVSGDRTGLGRGAVRGRHQAQTLLLAFGDQMRETEGAERSAWVTASNKRSFKNIYPEFRGGETEATNARGARPAAQARPGWGARPAPPRVGLTAPGAAPPAPGVQGAGTRGGGASCLLPSVPLFGCSVHLRAPGAAPARCRPSCLQGPRPRPRLTSVYGVSQPRGKPLGVGFQGEAAKKLRVPAGVSAKGPEINPARPGLRAHAARGALNRLDPSVELGSPKPSGGGALKAGGERAVFPSGFLRVTRQLIHDLGEKEKSA